MKKYILILSLLAAHALQLCAFNVTAKVSPQTILAGEPAALAITSDSAGDISFELPEVKGINWMRNGVSTSSSYSMINGKTTRSITRSIYFTVSEPGEYELPAIEVNSRGKKSFTRSVKFKVLAPGSAPGRSDNIPATARIVWPDTGKFYTGQWIPLEVVLTVPDGMDVGRYSFPRLSGVENLIFYNFSGNGQKRDFGEVKQERTVYKNVNATRVIFPAAVRTITSKVPDISGSVTIGIVRRSEDSRRSYDSFFDSFFERMNERIVPVNIPIEPAEKKPELAPLPPVPAGVHYLEIFGKADLSARLSAQKSIAGEAVELILTVVSDDISQLKAPEIKIDNFRIYKPEVKLMRSSAEIRYCLIPLEAGRKTIETTFGSFDTSTGKYQLIPVKLSLDVLPSKASVTLPEKEKEKTQQVETKKVEEPVKTPSLRTEPLYLKSGKFSRKHLTIWRNSLWQYITGFVMLPAIALLIYLLKKRRQRLLANPEEQLKRSIAKYAIAILSNNSNESLSENEKANIISACASALGMEQGTSASEIASQLSDEELQEWFRKIDESSFNFTEKKDITVNSSVRKKLIKLIKGCIILMCMMLPDLYANDANALFDSGKYLEAAEIYRSQLDEKHPSPELLYNYGTCCLRAGKYPAARAALLAAHKLAPRDEEITENLNLVNRRLVQSEVNKTDTPQQLFKYCRDRLTPDEHLAMAAIIFGIAMVVLALNPVRWKMTTGISGTVIAIFLYLMASQMYDSYAPYQAVTMPEYLELKQLPSNPSSKTIATIPGGSDAKILQTRGSWIEIEANGKTGWVPADSVALITH